jgi:basic membrane lipoprotein Med (substrate-binding protein (PBP1-ABC) superfamily)
MSNQMSISVLVIAIGVVTVLIAVTSKVIFSQDDTQDESAVNNQTMMMMPGGNMTFGSSLDNARMHLMEAIMNLNEGNIKGAIMQLNMTDQGIKMHEKEMMDMMKIMKPNMSSNISKTQNQSS